MKRKLILFTLLTLPGFFLSAQESYPPDSVNYLKWGTDAVHNRIESSFVKSIPGMDFSSGLEGMIPGLDVSPVGNAPGAYVRMLIRGAGSLNASNEPLIVVDGIPFENSSVDAGGYRFSGLGEIDANDISEVYILKDVASTALYGTRGSNGVVFIKTKTGSENRKDINVSYKRGISQMPKTLDLLTADGYMTTLNKAYRNSYPDATGQAPVALHTYEGFYSEPYTETIPGEEDVNHQPNLASTDWYNNMLETGSLQSVNLDWSGGDSRTIYYIGLGYNEAESLTYSGKYQRANARVNIIHTASDRFKLGLRTYIASNRRDVNDKSWFESAHSTSLPVYPVQSPADPDYYWFYQDSPVNLEALNQYSWNKSGGIRTFNTAFAQYSFLKNLSLKSVWSWDYMHYLNEDYKHPYVAPAENGLMIINRYSKSNWTTNNYLNYDLNSGDNRLNARLGMSVENYSWNGNMIYNPGMTLLFIHSNGESNQNRLVGVYLNNSRFVSYYGKLDYSYKNTYSLRVSTRVDGSSRFGEDSRYHYFPAVTAGWNLAAESFASDLSFLDLANISLGWGKTGNAGIGNFNHLSTMTEGYHDNSYTLTNGRYYYGDYPAVVPVNMANPKLGPEISTQINAGLDFAVLNYRLSGSFRYFNHNQTDLINLVPISPLYGYENPERWENNGEMNVSGFEFSLAPVIIDNEGGLKWDMAVSLTSVQSVLKALPEGVDYLESHFNRSYVDETFGGYFLPEWVGVDAVTGHEMIRNPIDGELVDAELLTDEEYSAMSVYMADKTPFPTMYGGLFSKLEFKGLDFSFLFSFRSGHSLLDLGEQSLSYIGSASTASEDLLKGWTADAPSDVPLLYETKMSSRVSSRFLHDASYMRLQRLSLGYTLPRSVSSRLFMKKTRLYVSGTNLLTFNSFPGYDPNGLYSSYSSMSNLDAGLLMFDPPQPRTMLLGIDFTF